MNTCILKAPTSVPSEAITLLVNSNLVIGSHKQELSKVSDAIVKVLPTSAVVGIVTAPGQPHLIIVGQYSFSSSLLFFLLNSAWFPKNIIQNW